MKLKNLFFILLFSLFSCGSDNTDEIIPASGNLYFDGVQAELNLNPYSTYADFRSDYVRIFIDSKDVYRSSFIFNELNEGNVNNNLTMAIFSGTISFSELISGNITYKKNGKKHVFTFDNTVFRQIVQSIGIPKKEIRVTGFIELPQM